MSRPPGPPDRYDDTIELLRETARRRARRRRLFLSGIVLAGLIVIAAVATGLAFAFSGKSSGGTVVVSTTSAGGTDTVATTGSHTSTTPSSKRPRGSTSTTVSKPTTSKTTSSQSTTSTTKRESSTTSSSAGSLSSKVVVIDPGHQAQADLNTEPIGPGSSQMKEKTSSGTQGVSTGLPESELNLAVSLKLRDALEAHGIRVVMTRTSQNVRLSNVQRAKIGNDAHADLVVRIHADGNDDHGMHGIHVLYPVSIPGWTDKIAAASKKAAALAQAELIAATGAVDRGIDPRDDMTGFNWSKVPVILPEVGFMSNAAEDRLLADAGYQAKIVKGLTRAVLSFLGAD